MAKKAPATPPVRNNSALAPPKPRPAQKVPQVPGVSPIVALTRNVTVESAKVHQTKKAYALVDKLGANVGDRIKVVATKTGFYDNKRQREGDVFHVLAEHFSFKWMERADGKAMVQAKPTGPNAAIARVHDQILGGQPVATAGDEDDDDGRPKGPAED